MTEETKAEEEKEEELFPEEETSEIKTEVEPKETEEKSEETKESTEETKEEKVEEKPEIKTVPIAALHDKKRQVTQLQEENAQLRTQIPKSSEAPDPFEDIDKYDAYKREEILKEVSEEQNRAYLDRLDKSRGQMAEKHSDYYEMEKIFELMTFSEPQLIEDMKYSGNEALFAYTKAKEYKDNVMGKTETTEKKPSESDLRNKAVVDTPSLATATAQASNLPQIKKEVEFKDLFKGQKY